MHELMITDHGFLRVPFQNLHWIDPNMVRSNQPSPRQLERYKAMGVRTVINLRGVSDTGYYALEREACERLGLTLVDAPVSSRDTPSKERLFRADEIFRTIAYPALMHCKSGADRAGLMAVLYKHLHMGRPLEEAVEQLGGRYLHVRQGKTGMLDFFFQTAIAGMRRTRKPFLEWVQDDYEPAAVKSAFMASWWGTILTDKILQRE
jgi:protein tyrosine/serine phosphatase